MKSTATKFWESSVKITGGKQDLLDNFVVVVKNASMTSATDFKESLGV